MERHRNDRQPQSLGTARGRVSGGRRVRPQAAHASRAVRANLGPPVWRTAMRGCTPAVALLLAVSIGQAASLSELMEEARRNNPDILAARRAWQAAAQIPTQVATMPDPTVSVQHLSVGSPRPFAGYGNSDFAYIGLGISQDLPYPGKLKLKGESAREDAAIARDKLDAVTRSVIEQVKEAY